MATTKMVMTDRKLTTTVVETTTTEMETTDQELTTTEVEMTTAEMETTSRTHSWTYGVVLEPLAWTGASWTSSLHSDQGCVVWYCLMGWW